MFYIIDKPDSNGSNDYALKGPELEEEGPEPYDETGTGTARNPNLETDIEGYKAMKGDAGVEIVTKHQFENYEV